MTRQLETSAGLARRARSAVGLTTALIAAAVALASCSTRGVAVGGESNWLATCDTDLDCGELGACRCGVCTSDCSVTADCNGFERATCANGDAADTQCADSTSVTSICLPTCSDARTCPNSQECVDGACTLTSASISAGGGTGAGGSSNGGSGDGGSSDGGAAGMTTDNPSGNCTAPDDGGRIDHAPDATDEYLPDCQLDLEREYYRVFRQQDGTAYMIPRPDGRPDLFAPCTDSEHELAGIVERYGLCESAESGAAVDVINAMAPTDALAVAHYLHTQLVFYPAGGTGITPYPFSDDILAACKEDAEFRAGPFAAQCEFELMYEDSPRPDIGVVYDAAQALALSVKLNEIYGISGGELDEAMGGACDRLQASAEAAMYLPISEADRSCNTDEDCVLWQANPCYDAGQCGASVAVADTTTLVAAYATLEDEQCGFFAELGCEAPGLAPCSYAPPVCRDSLCE